MSDSPEFCSRCGAALQPNSLFCPNCGLRVERAAQAEPAYQPTVKMPEPSPVEPARNYAAPEPYAGDVYNAPAPARPRRNPVLIIVGVLVGLCLCGFVTIAAATVLLGGSIASLVVLAGTATPTATMTSTPTRTPLPATATATQPAEPTPVQVTDIPAGPTQVNLSPKSSDNPFFDDFSTNRGWAVVEPEADPDYTVGWQGQYYSIKVKTPSISAWVFPPLTYAPTNIEFDATIPDNYSGQNPGTFGATCFYIDNQNYHQVEMDPFNNAYAISRYRDGDRISLTSDNWMTFNGFAQGAGATNHILVSCEGNNISLYINNQLAQSVQDSTLPVQESTRMGINVNTYQTVDPGGFEIWFDNFSAWVAQQ